MSTRQTRTLVSILILIIAVLIVIGTCATGKITVIEKDEGLKALIGIWTNLDYNYHPAARAKCIINPDGRYESYYTVDSERPANWGQYTIHEAWKDSKGTIWYKATWTDTWGTRPVQYEIGKIYDMGSTWESSWEYYDYPTELIVDHSSMKYKIMYRQ